MNPAVWDELNEAIDAFKNAIADEAEEGRVVIERAERLATAAAAALTDLDDDQLAANRALSTFDDSALEQTVVSANDLLQGAMLELAKRRNLSRLPG
jgi:ABC-type transporter Mla subunit MlaD